MQSSDHTLEEDSIDEIHANGSKAPARSDDKDEDVAAAVDAVDAAENPKRPTGFRFAIIYGCILIGDFFVGYVSRPLFHFLRLTSVDPTSPGHQLCHHPCTCHH
jgi:hypothetical protein